MKAHIVGGGFGGLAAAGYLIRHAGTPGPDITIYEADRQMGGGFFLGGTLQSGYNLPGSVFDSEFRCAFELLAAIPSAGDPKVSVKDEFFAFNAKHPFNDQAHIIDGAGQILHGPRFGLSLKDGFDLVRLSLTPEANLDGRRIEEFFSPSFFSTEFWLLWSTIMGSLPEHSAAEFRRYMNRSLHLFPYLSNMRQILRTPLNQYQSFIEPLAVWLRGRGVNFLTGAFVQDVGFASSADRLTVNRIDFEREGAANSVPVASDDIVLMTLGSQIENMSVGSMNAAPQPQSSGRTSALWRRLAQQHDGFGNPDVFFGADQTPSSRWVSFTVTLKGSEFVDQMTALTHSEPGSGGLVTLKNSSWRLSLTLFHQPEVNGQPDRHAYLLGVRPVSGKARRLREKTHERLQRDGDPGGGSQAPAFRPSVGPDQGLLDLHPLRHALCQQHLDREAQRRPAGRYPCRGDEFGADRPVRRASERHRLHHRVFRPCGVGSRPCPAEARPPPPRVYQSQYDPKALFAALKVFVFG